MKTLIIYDSYFGNTKKIAQEIYNTIEKKNDTKLCNVQDFKSEMLENVTLLIVGSPTRAFRASENISNMIKSIKDGSLNCSNVAVFDTRMDTKEVDSKILSFMANLFGYASKPMLKQLTKKGGIPVADPIGFYVKDKEGPLKDGELERSKEWVKSFRI